MANFQTAIPMIKAAEGGLSRATTDSASKNPAPWPYKGKTGWHTNKGITYETFVSMAPKLGYAVTAENFFTMPDGIWQRIYKHGYWDRVAGDKINSAALAAATVDYAFNFGVAGALRRISAWLKSKYNVQADNALSIADAFNRLAKDEKAFFESFIQHRKAAYIALKQPANEKGWLARMEDLQQKGLQLIANTVSAPPGAAGLAFFWLQPLPLPS